METEKEQKTGREDFAETPKDISTKRRKKRILTVIIVIAAVLLALLAAAYAVIHHYYSKSNYVRDAQVTVVPQEDLPEDVQKDNSVDSMSSDAQKEAEEKALAAQSETEFPNGEYVYNLLLIGSDRRDSGWYGNSDVMMLLSINKKTKTIYLTSFMRDSYAIIDGAGAHKLNYAYALGGGPLLVQTIEENYRISIDNYASADFDSTAQIVDLAGGVDIHLYQEECDYLTKSGVGDFPSAGTYHLNGEQAVAYGRIRYVGNNDYERTERQRKVMEQIFKKAKTLSLGDLNKLANAILPLITHNLTEFETVSLLTQLPAVMGYDLQLGRVPYDGLFHSEGELLVPDWEETIRQLHDTIYAEE